MSDLVFDLLQDRIDRVVRNIKPPQKLLFPVKLLSFAHPCRKGQNDHGLFVDQTSTEQIQLPHLLGFEVSGGNIDDLIQTRQDRATFPPNSSMAPTLIRHSSGRLPTLRRSTRLAKSSMLSKLYLLYPAESHQPELDRHF